MKYVAKQASPGAFEAWKALANAEWQPTYDSLQNPEKRALHDALLAEQGYVCCYCGRSIGLADSHVEHFRPQEARPDLALEFTNLFASCIRANRPGSPLHCCHAKGMAFDERMHISPLDAACEGRFGFGLDGAIYPADAGDTAALYMRQLLRLDLAFLNNRRGEVLRSIFDPDFLATVSDEELHRLSAAYRAPDGAGAVADFGHVVARFADQLLPASAA
jgi:uncharacterized protein (TIGR02646 family)